MSTRALQMVHKEDPKLVIQKAVAPYLSEITVLGAEVLIGIYVRPDASLKLAGGKELYLPDRVRAEDKFQGKVGLVLKMGPIAFKEDSTHRFGDAVPQVGDWVALRVGDSFQISVGEQMCRIAEDVNFKLIVKHPDAVY
ncbi:MAG: hypothetical protein ACREQ5_09195 [Candidatus Dormibacteria bacterium]